jgi:hypothetical protein
VHHDVPDKLPEEERWALEVTSRSFCVDRLERRSCPVAPREASGRGDLISCLVDELVHALHHALELLGGEAPTDHADLALVRNLVEDPPESMSIRIVDPISVRPEAQAYRVGPTARGTTVVPIRGRALDSKRPSGHQTHRDFSMGI